MTQQPSEDELRSSAVQSMSFLLAQVDNLTDDSKTNAIIRNMFQSENVTCRRSGSSTAKTEWT